MKSLSIKEGQAFQQELLDLMLCREAKNFVDNEQSYVNEDEDYIVEFNDTLNDPSFNNCTSHWHLSKLDNVPNPI